MKTNAHFWPYRAQLFLEWEMFQTEVVERIETHFIFGTFFFFENYGFCDIKWKIFFFFWRAGEATDENMAQGQVTLGN